MEKDNSPEDKLWTSSFVCICTGNFLLFFAFYLLLPILPLYMMEVFGASKSAVGAILSCYTLAALFIRPAAGFFLDIFNRRPLFLLGYFLFVLTFIGYPLVSLISFFLLLRILHGLTFGMVSTAGNSLVIDIMPPSRRGEGLGYFGVANNIAMATGPMISLFMHDYYSYNTIFYGAIGSGLLGCLIVLQIKTRKQPEQIKQPIALDRFFLKKGTKSAVCLTLLGVPYGMLTTYVAIYGKELGVQRGMGIFFSFMAAGLIISRLFAGKAIDRGKLLPTISYGTIICLIAFMSLSGIGLLRNTDSTLLVSLFYLIAFVLGVGYGMVFPSYNALFVNLAPNNRRATASSTYLTSWDVGVGSGLILGGFIADLTGGLPMSFFVGAIAVCASFILFIRLTAPHYERNKLR